MSALEAGLVAMVPPLEGGHAAPWLLCRLESSPGPGLPWERGWLGERCRSKDGAFNVPDEQRAEHEQRRERKRAQPHLEPQQELCQPCIQARELKRQ